MRATITQESLHERPLAMGSDRAGVDSSFDGSMIEPSFTPESTSQRTSGRLTRFARMIGRQLPSLMIVTFLSVVAAFAALQSATPLYTVSAQVMIQRISGNGIDQSPNDKQQLLRNEEQLISSTPVVASALAMPGVHEMSLLRGRPDALRLVKQALRVEPGKGDDLLDVSYDAADPREGTALLGAIVDSYVRFRSGLHGTAMDGSTATVLAEKKRALDTLAQKRAALQQFSTEHGLAQGDEQVDADDEALHELGIKLAQARVDTVASKAAYDDMQIDLADDPHMQERLAQAKDNDSSLAGGDADAITKEICTLQTQLAGFGTKFMVNYAPIQMIHRKVEDLKLTRDEIITQHWKAAMRSEAELKSSYAQQESAAEVSQANKLLFDQHKAEVDDAQKQIAAFDKQLKDLDAANKLISTMVTVIEPATASDRPTKPRTGLILIIATLAGFSLGTCVAAFRDRHVETQPLGSLKMIGDGLPLLAKLPAVPRRQLAMNSWRDRMVDSAAEFAEACHSILGALQSVVSFSGGRTVLVTSTNAHEGKSTLASLLALTLAQTGKRVLLVDANLHASVQGRIFGIDGDYGLGDLLEEEIESSFISYVHPGTDPRMDILLSGSTTTPIADLLNSQRFTNIMAAMAAEYDYVLIDSPAMVAGPDARIIASACDATILLARESSVNRKAVNKSRDSLTSVGGNVIGVVLNGGMSAAGQMEALVSIDVSRHAMPAPAPVMPAPVQVTTVRLNPKVEAVQSVVAAQVRRAVDVEPDAVDAMPLEEVERFPWIWSYLLMLAVLIGGWIAFNDQWSAAAMRRSRMKDLAGGHLTSAAPLISQREEPVGILMAGGALVAVLLLAGIHTRPPRHEIVLIAASAALAAFSFHGGMIGTLANEQQHSFAPASTAESILLFVSMLVGWNLLQRTRTAKTVDVSERDSAADIALAIFANASVTSALMIVLSHWETKGECLAVLAFSSCIAAMMAYWIAPLRSSFCFWMSPLAVAIFGYVCAAMSMHGFHVGMLMALARPQPMDYASMGPIGAVLGFWIARSMGRIAWPTSLAGA